MEWLRTGLDFLRTTWATAWGQWNWYVQDAIVAGLVLGVLALVWQLSRREYWRLAYREVVRRRLAVVSFGVICLYVSIAFLDSVGWHPPLRDAKGVTLTSPEGKTIWDPKGLSMLDYLLRSIRAREEKTFSAPLAREQFTSELMVDEQGQTRMGHPSLQYPGQHLFGTDKVGNDVLYLSLKGIRTGIIIGAVTTLLAVPFAILFGLLAGYFGGWVDDAIQYFYTVLSSIPNVLVIVAFMVIAGRGLPQLCLVMGITSWTGLCRVLRGETMKLREMEFIQSAKAMGVPAWKILARHIVPNVLHVVLITAVLRFSDQVLAEAALTYMGIGVDPSVTISWGQMIVDARLELARDPVIWWKLVAAFVFMLGLVLPTNVFGDALRDALDPRLRTR